MKLDEQEGNTVSGANTQYITLEKALDDFEQAWVDLGVGIEKIAAQEFNRGIEEAAKIAEHEDGLFTERVNIRRHIAQGIRALKVKI